MNGARTEPCANTSNAPTSAMTTTIGRSHHFFRTLRNSQNSAARLDMTIFLLELMGQVTACITSVRPVTPLHGPVPDRVAPEEAHEEPDRRDDDEEYDSHEQGSGNLRDQQRQSHPAAVDGPELPRHHHTRNDERGRERAEDVHRRLVLTPPHHRGQQRERRADREAELAPLRGTQSSWNSVRHSVCSSNLGCLVLSST